MMLAAEGRGERSPMQYRRFGKTEKRLSVITLGGMRYVDGWSKPRDEPHRAMIEQAMACITRAREVGINHFETAYAYSKSEHCYGRAFQELGVPRESYYLMTKGAPETSDEVHQMIAEQLAGLRTDHIDLYGYHGINNQEILGKALRSGGPVETLLRYREEGVIGHIGFSTHAPFDVICRAIESGLFEFVNLHYYYFFQRNYGALQLAQKRDMGVFIISPNDKGGRLYSPSSLLSGLTAPLTPLQWNARFCLRLPGVHTLSFGMTASSHFDEMLGVLPSSVPLSQADLAIEVALDARREVDPLAAYEGYEFESDPSGINIPEVLRFRRMALCYDMLEFARYRYNMFEEKGHWFPGRLATPERVALVDERRIPPGVPLRALLTEAHELLYVPKASAS